MIVKPMIRNNICLNAHPAGCAREVENQIAFVKAQNAKRGRKPGAPVSGGTHPNGPVKAALILGCSTGYGLASRITASFGYGAATVGVSFEKEASEAKSGTPGWYVITSYSIHYTKLYETAADDGRHGPLLSGGALLPRRGPAWPPSPRSCPWR